MTENSHKPMLVLGTAIAVTMASQASAATTLVSKAGADFKPVTVTSTTGSYSFDIDGNGSDDFKLVGGESSIMLQYLNTATSGAATFASSVTGFASTSSLVIGNVKTGSTGYINANFGTNGGQYAALATNATFKGDYATSGTLGYLQGTYTGGATPSFSLLDFGLVTDGSTVAAVPEPASWVLLLTGFGAVGAAVRRSRKTKDTAASLAA